MFDPFLHIQENIDAHHVKSLKFWTTVLDVYAPINAKPEWGSGYPQEFDWLSRELGFCLYMMSPGWLHLELFEVYNWPLLALGWGILILLTKYVVPGVRNLISFQKMSKSPPPCLIRPTLGFTSMCELEFLGGGGYSKIRISMNFYFIFCNFEVGSSSLVIFSIKSTNLNLHKT